jgi:hypothetical protein
MSIAAHRQCGLLLKTVGVAAMGRAGVQNLEFGIRGELDEWVMREYGRAGLDQATFLSLYLPGPPIGSTTAIDRVEMVQMLNSVGAILVQHYPDCAPLRRLLKMIERAVTSIVRWGGIH